MSDTLPVHAAWSAVMGSVQAIAKKDQNTQQKFSFRGIDAVMSAVGPALREHSVAVIPTAQELISDTYETKGGTVMRNATVLVGWTIVGPAGDTMQGASYGEAADAGDKAVSKAHSVAYRTFLLQALCVPTNEPDADTATHERVQRPPRTAPQAPPPLAAAKARVWQLTAHKGDDRARQAYIAAALDARGSSIANATVMDLHGLADEWESNTGTIEEIQS